MTLLPLIFLWPKQIIVPAFPQQARECISLLCPKAQDPEILVRSIDVYRRRGLPILKVRNLRISDINNFGKTTLFLEWWH